MLVRFVTKEKRRESEGKKMENTVELKTEAIFILVTDSGGILGAYSSEKVAEETKKELEEHGLNISLWTTQLQ